MNRIRRILWIVRKNAWLALADRKGLFFSFLLPAVLAAITGFAFSGTGGGPASRVKVAVIDLDGTDTTAKVVRSLSEADTLDVTEMQDLASARTLIRKRKILAAVVFPEGAGEKLAGGLFADDKADIDLLIDPSRRVERGLLQGVLMREVMKAVSADMMNPSRARDQMRRGLASLEGDTALDTGEREKWRDFLESGVAMFDRLETAQQETGEGDGAAAAGPDFSQPFRLHVEEVTAAKSGFSMYAQTFSGTGVMFLLFGVMGAATNLVQERRNGTLRRMLASPVGRVEILAGEGIFYFFFSMVQLAVLFAVGKALFDIPFAGSRTGLLMIAAATGFAVTGFGLVVAAVGKTEKQVQGIAVLIILVMSCLGGSWFPVWLMPKFMQTLASATINKWAVMGFEGATWRGFGFLDILLPYGAVLFGMGAVMFAVAAWRFRWE